MIPGVVEKILYAISRCPISFDMLSVKSTPKISGHCASAQCQFLISGWDDLSGLYGSFKNVLLSEYSLAISATASPILLRTEFVVSALKASRSFCRIT